MSSSQSTVEDPRLYREMTQKKDVGVDGEINSGEMATEGIPDEQESFSETVARLSALLNALYRENASQNRKIITLEQENSKMKAIISSVGKCVDLLDWESSGAGQLSSSRFVEIDDKVEKPAKKRKV